MSHLVCSSKHIYPLTVWHVFCHVQRCTNTLFFNYFTIFFSFSYTEKAQNVANSCVCDPPVTPNIIYNHKVKRKNSLSSYSSVEIHRIRNQDPNLLNRPAWTDARIALLQIKKVIFICVSDRFGSHSLYRI